MEDTDREISEEALSYVRSEMLQALSIAMEHIKYTINLCSTVLAAGAALLGYALKDLGATNQTESSIVVMVFAGVCFSGVIFLSSNSKKIVERYYKIYSTSYVYSARLHKIAGGSVVHDWHLNLEELIGDPMHPKASKRFMKFETKVKGGENHSWFYYRRIIGIFGWVGGVALIANVYFIFSAIKRWCCVVS